MKTVRILSQLVAILGSLLLMTFNIGLGGILLIISILCLWLAVVA